MQIAALLFFVYLLFAALQNRSAFPLADLFFRFDPLAALATMIAKRGWLGHFSLALLVVGLALLVGRVWCGWLCPMGTIDGWVKFKGARRRAQKRSPRWRAVKYVLLLVIVVMAVFHSLSLMVFDPLGLLTRTMTTAVIPGFDWGFTKAEQVMMHVGHLHGTVNYLEQHLRDRVLPVNQPLYSQSTFLALLFVGVLALNAFADKFWCRYLCPLGALLGLLSKVQVLRPVIGKSCDGCNRCAAACRTGAIESAKAAREPAALATALATAAAEAPSVAAPEPATPPAPVVVSSECTMCLDCLVACPGTNGAMTLGLNVRPGPWRGYDPGRRQFVTALVGGVGAIAVLGTGVWHKQPSPKLLRPPGADHEHTFLSACLRCSQCMKVCPTSGLQPALNEAGIEGIWTPVLKPRVGYCDYACNACGQTCPSGAIPKFSLGKKRKQVIGTAVIDKNRCLPWAQNVPCAVCQEMCPVPEKAITLDAGRTVTDAQGNENWLVKPSMVPDLCIGCGICEYMCPVNGTAAIVVETRNIPGEMNTGTEATG